MQPRFPADETQPGKGESLIRKQFKLTTSACAPPPPTEEKKAQLPGEGPARGPA